MLLEAALALRVGRAREVELLELRPRVVRAVLVGGLVLDGRLRRAAPLEQLSDAREDPRLEVRVRVTVSVTVTVRVRVSVGLGLEP